jgi:hypothetical protein
MPEGSQQQLQLQVVQLQQRILELEQDQQQLQAELAQHAALSAGLQAKLSNHEAANQQHLSPVKEEQEDASGAPPAAAGFGIKPIQTQRSVDANSPALLPSTPGGDKPQRGAFYSSDGGGSNNSSSGGAPPGRSQHGSSGSNRKPSRLSSTSGSAAAAGAGHRPASAAAAAATRQRSRAGSTESGAAAAAATAAAAAAAAAAAEPRQQEQQQSQAGALAAESSDGGAASKAGGVSYASQQWEESKQLQGRIDSLRWAAFLSGNEDPAPSAQQLTSLAVALIVQDANKIQLAVASTDYQRDRQSIDVLPSALCGAKCGCCLQEEAG